MRSKLQSRKTTSPFEKNLHYQKKKKKKKKQPNKQTKHLFTSESPQLVRGPTEMTLTRQATSPGPLLISLSLS
jgi:hypothetical protein